MAGKGGGFIRGGGGSRHPVKIPVRGGGGPIKSPANPGGPIKSPAPVKSPANPIVRGGGDMRRRRPDGRFA